jgi:hypothetical protein
VFALLSLIRTGYSTLRPDYDLTAAQVFSEAARISSECGRLFDILWFSCRDLDSALKRSLPSWVPNFNDPDRTYPILRGEYWSFSAGGNKTPKFSFSENGLVLKLKGKILDTISILLSDPPGPGPLWSLYQEWYKKCKDLAGCTNGDYTSTEQFLNFWWRLAICDLHMSSRWEVSRASSGFGSFYLDQTITEPFSSDIEKPYFVLQEDPLQRKQTEYLQSLLEYSTIMAFCRTEKRYLGWVPPYAHSYDRICLFEGDAVPWVIRPRSDGTFQLVGEAYIHGIMDGEAIGWEGSQWEDIQLS